MLLIHTLLHAFFSTESSLPFAPFVIRKNQHIRRGKIYLAFLFQANKSERSKKSPTFKDLDFMEHHPEGIFLEADTYTALVNTIKRDCRVMAVLYFLWDRELVMN